jgi:hypothetical protein
MALAWDSDGSLVVGEAGPSFGRGFPNLGPRLTFIDGKSGRVLGRFGAGYGIGPDQFMAPHGVAVAGDTIYVGEVAQAAWRFLNKETPPPGLPTIRKLVRDHAQ